MVNTPKKILALLPIFIPLGTVGATIRVVKFMKYLYPLGREFEVLTLDLDRLIVYIPRNSQVLEEELPPGIRIHRIAPFMTLPKWMSDPAYDAKIATYDGKSGNPRSLYTRLKRLLRPLKFWALVPDEGILWHSNAVRAGVNIAHKADIGAIFVPIPPPSAALAALAIGKKTNIPVIMDVRDDWVGTADFHAKPAPVRWLESRLERRAVLAASRVISVTPESQDGFRKRYPNLPPEKFVLIPNGVDLDEYRQPGDASATAKNCFKIVCANGGIGPRYRDATPLFLALEKLLDQAPQWRNRLAVHFLGTKLPACYHEFLQSRGMGSMIEEIFLDSRAEFIRQVKQADLLLSIQTDRLQTSVSATIYEYWAAGGSPILLISKPGATRSMVENNGLGAAFSPDQVAEMVAYLLAALTAWEKGMPLRITSNGIDRYDRRNFARQLEGLFQSCIGQ